VLIVKYGDEIRCYEAPNDVRQVLEGKDSPLRGRRPRGAGSILWRLRGSTASRSAPTLNLDRRWSSATGLPGANQNSEGYRRGSIGGAKMAPEIRPLTALRGMVRRGPQLAARNRGRRLVKRDL
jgi:hypothetical protein